MSLNSPKYYIYLSTDPGKVREKNEDNFVINEITKDANKSSQHIKGKRIKEPILCGVFDGMGGEKGGFEASETAVLVAAEFYKYLAESDKSADEGINAYLKNCDNLIKKYLRENKLTRGGTTFALAYFKNGKIQMFSMGDTRIYLLRDNKLLRISRDHTLAQKKYEAKLFTKEEAEASKESHMLTRFIGMDNDSYEFEPEKYQSISLNKNDKLLICSDGLYDMCSDSEIEKILSIPDQMYSIALVKAARAKGGVDNITCMVVELADL